MAIGYIRSTYGVPAKRGVSVKFTGNPHKCPQLGTITGSHGQYLKVRMDGDHETGSYHPTWRMEYLVPNTQAERPGMARREKS